jgi:hypothetical protein
LRGYAGCRGFDLQVNEGYNTRESHQVNQKITPS